MKWGAPNQTTYAFMEDLHVEAKTKPSGHDRERKLRPRRLSVHVETPCLLSLTLRSESIKVKRLAWLLLTTDVQLQSTKHSTSLGGQWFIGIPQSGLFT